MKLRRGTSLSTLRREDVHAFNHPIYSVLDLPRRGQIARSAKIRAGDHLDTRQPAIRTETPGNPRFSYLSVRSRKASVDCVSRASSDSAGSSNLAQQFLATSSAFCQSTIRGLTFRLVGVLGKSAGPCMWDAASCIGDEVVELCLMRSVPRPRRIDGAHRVRRPTPQFQAFEV